MQETINALRSDLNATQQENEALARGLRRECEEVTEKVQQLRAKLCSAQEAERTRLVNQIKCSDNACKKLQDIMGKVNTFITHSHTAGQFHEVKQTD